MHKSFHFIYCWNGSQIMCKICKSEATKKTWFLSFFFNLLHSRAYVLKSLRRRRLYHDDNNNFAREMHLNHEIIKWFIVRKMQFNKDVISYLFVCHNALVDYEISGSFFNEIKMQKKTYLIFLYYMPTSSKFRMCVKKINQINSKLTLKF